MFHDYSHDVGQRQGPTTIIEAVNIIVCRIMHTATLVEACVVVNVIVCCIMHTATLMEACVVFIL